MTRLSNTYGAINLAQGYPDFPAPPELKEAAKKAISEDYNQYAITWGSPRLREAIAEKVKRFNGIEAKPDENITVTCGATEAMMASMLALVNPGEEVVIFEPFYENYGPDAIVSGARPRFVHVDEHSFRIDPEAVKNAFTKKTRAIILNTPNNPLGKVFSHDELSLIADLCSDHEVYAVTDEVYEHIVYDGKSHISIATLPGMRDLTVTISAASKTYSVTGWRVGWAIAAKEVTNAIKRVHDFLTVGSPAPLQEAVASALRYPDSYYRELASMYARKRDLMFGLLEAVGFKAFKPNAAYYIMTDFTPFGFDDDVEFARYLVKEVGVATVPGTSFYYHKDRGRTKVRFMFSKRDETLAEAGERLSKLKEIRRSG